MNLIEPIGQRERLSWDEVSSILRIPKKRLKSMVYKSNFIPKKFSGEYPFDRVDVSRFLNDFNAGRINIGRGRRNAS